MSKFFSLDSPFMRAMSRIADLMILNLLFILTSIPIFTIGPGLAAMYTVCFRFGTDDEGSTSKDYFRAFKENFRQGVGLWLILLLIMGATFFTAALFYTMGGLFHLIWILAAALLVLALFIFSYAFPLMSQFENKNRMTFKNSLILSIAYLPRSILMAALNALPVALVLTQMYVFLHVGFIWFTLYFGTVAYLNSLLLKKVFKPYYEKDSEEIQEDET